MRDGTQPSSPASAPDRGAAAVRSASAAGIPTDAEQFALLIDSVREYAIYMMDPEGTILTWNVGGQRIKGYAPAEAIGHHFSMMFTEEDRAAGKPGRLLGIAASDGVCRDEGWRQRKDGSRFWASATLTAIRGADGRLAGFAKVSRDETERHALDEERRRHAEALEAAVAQRTRELSSQSTRLTQVIGELEQFNYVTSHDLQEPLRMVTMYMQKLIRDGDAAPAEQRLRYMRYAQEGAERMRLLIEDLLRYGRIDREDEPAETVPSREAVDAAIENLAPALAGRDVALGIGDLPVVPVRRSQLILIFQNLIGNAVKYAPDRRVEIAIAAVRIGPEWQFSVRDNGIGIDGRFHERIFSVFQRLHDRTRYPGTGMGLAICRKVVARHGGRIWVSSRPGAGSTFHFTLPAAAA